uniref:Uncharacterized protein n=1 Tax=Lepeophtheirus salmonis TaxID=72036 RepID=A0A0K2V0K9_LEPSM
MLWPCNPPRTSTGASLRASTLIMFFQPSFLSMVLLQYIFFLTL